MNGERALSNEPSDSTPWPWPWSAAAVQPTLVVCPIPTAGPGAFPGAAEDMYLLAYERALAAERPSRYELARATIWN